MDQVSIIAITPSSLSVSFGIWPKERLMIIWIWHPIVKWPLCVAFDIQTFLFPLGIWKLHNRCFLLCTTLLFFSVTSSDLVSKPPLCMSTSCNVSSHLISSWYYPDIILISSVIKEKSNQNADLPACVDFRSQWQSKVIAQDWVLEILPCISLCTIESVLTKFMNVCQNIQY